MVTEDASKVFFWHLNGLGMKVTESCAEGVSRVLEGVLIALESVLCLQGICFFWIVCGKM